MGNSTNMSSEKKVTLSIFIYCMVVSGHSHHKSGSLVRNGPELPRQNMRLVWTKGYWI